MEGIRARLGTAAFGIVLCAALAACGESAAPTPVPSDIKPADAMKVVSDFWKAREDAYVGLDSSKLDAVEAGDLAKIDATSIAGQKKRGLPGQKAPRALGDVKVYAPHQKDYPAQFLAVSTAPDQQADLSLTAKTYTQAVVFIKPDPDTPYQAVMLTVVDPGQSLPELKVGKDGFALLVAGEGQAATYKAAASQMGQKLADELNNLTTGAKGQADLAAGLFTTQEADLEKELVSGLASRGVDLKISRAGKDNAGNFAYQTVDGSALDFFATNSSILFVAKAGNGGGGCIILPPSSSDVLKKQPPGIYRALNLEEVTMMAAVVPPATDKTRLITVAAAASGSATVEDPPCS
ncbi:MAG: hypothetical protein QOK05_2162 [Chloroflexota bacterium]|nr:hypothetical protein [Chloroflexota bacterium]